MSFRLEIGDTPRCCKFALGPVNSELNNYLMVGTASGYIYIIDFLKKCVKGYYKHGNGSKAVNAIEFSSTWYIHTYIYTYTYIHT